jgi:asparagine synthase (glutamine-hydrolysing)
MCGIAGQFGKVDEEFAGRALEGLRHRGPDSQGVWRSEAVLIVHTRLAIIDLGETGQQPMLLMPDGVMRNAPQLSSTVSEPPCASGANPKACLIFNGEIYNYRELRADLIERGEVFHSESDTEVLLRLLLRDGEAALPKLSGMFAFALWDFQKQKALLARDPLGIKPLYYRCDAGQFSFASEVKVLAQEDDVCNVNALRDYFLWGSFQEPQTCNAAIEELPAGSLLRWDAGKVETKKWSKVSFSSTNVTSKTPAAYVRERLEASVRRHLVSDVPVGIFLSGGLDSTAILALTRKILGTSAKIHTFSIGFQDAASDESAMAKRTAEVFGTEHSEWIITPEDGAKEIIPFLQAVDQPTIDGFNVWCVSKLAKQAGIKVALSGQGGDELFGGYPSFRRVPFLHALYHWLGPLRGLPGIMLPLSSRRGQWGRLPDFLASRGGWLEAFHCQRGIFTLEEASKLAQFFTGRKPDPVNWSMDELPTRPVEKVAYLETKKYLRNQLLRDSDAFSMAHGFELRVPMVDAQLLEELRAVPSAIRFQTAKKILQEAIPEIPDWVKGQGKKGFSFPFEKWMRLKFGQVLNDACRDIPLKPTSWYQTWSIASFVLCAKSHSAPRKLSQSSSVDQLAGTH